MVTLFKQDIRTNDRQSSKGNQLKWLNGDTWYKADYAGYEGMAEYMVSELLKHSNASVREYVLYETEEIHYKYNNYRGCKSNNFLGEGWQMLTLERLFQSAYNQSLNKCIYTIRDYENRIRFLVEQTERLTGLKDFGKYISKLLTIDALFLNEDRHTHNIAVLLDADGSFHYCPVFDNGASLLSDITMDYPLNIRTEELIKTVKPKTFCRDFDTQLEIVEKLYGQHLTFSFSVKDIERLLQQEAYYPKEIKQRVLNIFIQQRRKYQYLFLSD